MKKIFTFLVLGFMLMNTSGIIAQIHTEDFENSTLDATATGQKDSWITNGLSDLWSKFFTSATDKTMLATIINTEVHTGTKALEISIFQANGAVRFRTEKDATAGETKYKISYWAKTDATGVSAQANAGAGMVNATAAVPTNAGSDWNTLTTSYQYFEDITTSSGGSNPGRIFIYFNDLGSDFKVYMDDFVVEEYVPTAIGDDTEIKSLSVYPNPASDKLYVDAEGVIDMVKIYNISGQQVMKVADFSKGIDISGLTKGMYIVSTTIEGKPVQKKFTKR